MTDSDLGMTEPTTYYQNKIAELNELLEKQKKKANLMSISRLLLFIVVVALVVISFQSDWFWIIFAMLLLGIFLRLVSLSTDIENQILLTKKLLFINKNELQVLDNQPSMLYDGSDKIDVHGYDFDLNIFGKFSVFHQINRTGFLLGTDALVQLLKKPLLKKTKIEQFQKIAQELATKTDFRQNILANGLLINEKEQNSLKKLSEQQVKIDDFQGFLWKFGNVVWSVLAFIVLCASVYFSKFQFLFEFWLLGLGIKGFINKKVSVLHEIISNQKRVFENLLNVFELMKNEIFEDLALKNLQNQAIDAQIAFDELSKIADKFDQRRNMLAAALLNGFTLYDIYCVKLLLKWREKYQNDLPKWFGTVAEIEVFNSLGTFVFNNPTFVFPKIDDEKLIFEAQELGHPLLAAPKRICNDVVFSDSKNIFLLTGANMSGKSTFLRSIGVNLLLAQIGSPVCAKSLIFSPLTIQTSLHQTDSLEENKSYFYAELERIQRIVRNASKEKCLILLDEVLRGTNSEDKRNGTSLLIKRLMQENCLTVLATHDVELGELEKEFPKKLENLCFESQIINDDLIFDYKLRKGVAQNKNATFLMKKMEII